MGGRAITGPTGGLLAIAGGGAAGVTIWVCCLGWGTTRRGAGAAGAAASGALAFKTGLDAAFGALATAGGAGVAAGRRGAWRASSSACLRARIAFTASPGLEMWARLKAGLASTCGLVAALLLLRLPLR